MPVTDHPLYDEWSRALDRLKAANDRYRRARQSGEQLGFAAIVDDLRKAHEDYDRISAEIGE